MNTINRYLFPISIVIFFLILNMIFWNIFLEQKGISLKLIPTFTHSTPKQTISKGIDISHYQGTPNWADLKSQIDFIFIKATQGTSEVDPNFSKNKSAAKHYKIRHGFYHFYDPNKSPEEQANHFITTVGSEPFTLPPIVDIEVLGDQTNTDIVKDIKTFVSIVGNKLNTTPIIYTYMLYFNEYFKGSSIEQYRFWIADYDEYPQMAKGIKMPFVQYSEKGQITGIEGDVDLDQFNGSPHELKELLCW